MQASLVRFGGFVDQTDKACLGLAMFEALHTKSGHSVDRCTDDHEQSYPSHVFIGHTYVSTTSIDSTVDAA